LFANLLEYHIIATLKSVLLQQVLLVRLDCRVTLGLLVQPALLEIQVERG
jgi:hypothetical protein